MKIAIIHDSLVEFGGAERVLGAMLSILPTAHVFTGFYHEAFVKTFFPDLDRRRLHGTWVQKIPFLWSHISLFHTISPVVWSSLNLSAFDLVISHTTHLMGNMVSVPSRAIHIQYIQSPPKNIFGIDPPTPWQKLTGYDRLIRPVYARALAITPHILTNSLHTKRVLKRLFGIDASVLYPPVTIQSRPLRHSGSPSYYLTVSRLDRGKNIELAILACNKLRVPLKIVGLSNEPRYQRYLRSIAGPTIEFLGFVPDNRLHALYSGAIAFIFPSLNEDFGIVPLEATAHGIPVVGFYGGGTKETVKEGITGTFFHSPTADSLRQAVQKVRHMRFDKERMYAWAGQFRYQRFRRELLQYIEATSKKRISGARR